MTQPVRISWLSHQVTPQEHGFCPMHATPCYLPRTCSSAKNAFSCQIRPFATFAFLLPHGFLPHACHTVLSAMNAFFCHISPFAAFAFFCHTRFLPHACYTVLSITNVFFCRMCPFAAFTFSCQTCVLLPRSHLSSTHGFCPTPATPFFRQKLLCSARTLSCLTLRSSYIHDTLLCHLYTQTDYSNSFPIRPLFYLGVSKLSLVASPGFTRFLIFGCCSSV